jgi:tight adherence protein B
MSDTIFPVLSILVFLSVLLLFQGIYLLWRARRGKAAQRLQRRLDLAGKSMSTDGQRSLLKQSRLSDMSMLARVLSGTSFALFLESYIDQAGLRWSVGRLLLTSGTATAAGFAFATFMSLPFLMSLMFALLLGLLPWFWLVRTRSRRLRKLSQQLPDALDLIARAMRAGHSLPLGIQLLADEMPDPIASEFRTVHEQVSFGATLQQALANLCEHVPLTDFRYFAVSVLIQRQSGGNLTEVLGNLSALIRERLKLHGRIRVLSSEGRMSAWTLGVLPFALAGLMYTFNPDFIRPLWTDPIGISIIQTLLTMMLLGVLVLVKITKIRV